MERIPCKKCLGKGKAFIKNPDEQQKGFDISVTCPACGGSGYEGIYGRKQEYYEDELESQMNNSTIQNNIPDKSEMIDQEKDRIINQIIKYPELFTTGKEFNYIDENIQLFIYLKNQYMFNIKQNSEFMLITLKNEYKNKLAEMIINKLKRVLYK